jgi:hypothetical protein
LPMGALYNAGVLSAYFQEYEKRLGFELRVTTLGQESAVFVACYSSGCNQFQSAPNTQPITKPIMEVTPIRIAAVNTSKAVMVYGG